MILNKWTNKEKKKILIKPIYKPILHWLKHISIVRLIE